jgi:hypothetical protein
MWPGILIISEAIFNPFKKEIAMFWAGLVVGLMLGAPLGMFVLAFMICAKRGRDASDQAVSDVGLQALSRG